MAFKEYNRDHLETLGPSLPNTISIYICCPGLIINSAPLDLQNSSNMRDKLYIFPRWRAQKREKSLGCQALSFMVLVTKVEYRKREYKNIWARK